MAGHYRNWKIASGWRAAAVAAVCCLVVVLAAGCRQGGDAQLPPLQRATVDRLNKESFLWRYRQPDKAQQCAMAALRYIDDSLPSYDEGRIRAWNNLAFSYYMMSQYNEAGGCIDTVLAFADTRHGDAERVIALLLEARIEQRIGNIADSYQLLYDIEREGLLRNHRDDVLHNYALTEYYITMLALNYHYRDGEMTEDIHPVLAEIESRRSELRCDYAQDMALNYALANSYLHLCTQGENNADNVQKALAACGDNLLLLSDSALFCRFQFANTLEMIADIVSFDYRTDTETHADHAWTCPSYVDTLCELLSLYGMQAEADSTLPARLYDEAQHQMVLYGWSPYAEVRTLAAAAHYNMMCGDTAAAFEYLTAFLDGEYQHGIAPKQELRLYNMLLASGYAASDTERRDWHTSAMELQRFMHWNEDADFFRRMELDNAERRARSLAMFAVVTGVLVLLLAVALVLLWRRTRQLNAETRALQLAKRHDVERIANVESCLSVLRHDITPFVAYLQNKELPPSLREEVLQQLLRTFENIKQWTNLSIPEGVQFRGETVSLQAVMDHVSAQVLSVKPDSDGHGTEVLFDATPLQVQGDALLLEILLRNLVNNALLHAHASRIKVHAEPMDDEPGMVHITVADDGCGMSAEAVESLFRADRPEGGHGFGLILCRYIIKKHDDNTRRGCRIWAESTEGAGTTFHVAVAEASTHNPSTLKP
ncbi:MAG: DUF5112 domain-containing protein [Bacteroidales bacterium]|nr:DUF5112 domain-containing protein [Bacteroidales bacterium]